jgi:Tat protein translocase TatB subunit
MFNLGFSEIVIIGVLALILIGPKQLPEMARVLGRLIAEFKKATSELSGGLLEVKEELRKPMREGLEEFQNMKETIRARVEEEIRRNMQGEEKTEESTVKQEKDEPKS